MKHPLIDAAEVIKEFCQAYSYKDENAFVRELRKREFTDEQIKDVVCVLQNMCKHCFDSDPGCPCWNDE